VPIYEYLCEGCAHKFEIKQSMKDDPIATCTRCGQPVKRLISSPAIMFKGSGWYVTDYSDKLKPPSDAESGGTADGEKKDAAASPAGTTTATPPPAASPTPAATSAPTATPSAPASTPTTPSTSNK
jgi:putative FmdB family regulatory protein